MDSFSYNYLLAMTIGNIERAALPVADLVATAHDLARAGRWQRAESLLDAANAVDARGRALLAVAAAEVAVERDWSTGTDLASGRLATAQERCAELDLDAATRWDLDFVRLRQDLRGVAANGRHVPTRPPGGRTRMS